MYFHPQVKRWEEPTVLRLSEIVNQSLCTFSWSTKPVHASRIRLYQGENKEIYDMNCEDLHCSFNIQDNGHNPKN
jgi:hypothetical protein